MYEGKSNALMMVGLLVGALLSGCAPASQEEMPAEMSAEMPDGGAPAAEPMAAPTTTNTDTDTVEVKITIYPAKGAHPCTLAVDPPMVSVWKNTIDKPNKVKWARQDGAVDYAQLRVSAKNSGADSNNACFTDTHYDIGAAPGDSHTAAVNDVANCKKDVVWYYSVEACWTADCSANDHNCVYDPGVMIED